MTFLHFHRRFRRQSLRRLLSENSGMTVLEMMVAAVVGSLVVYAGLDAYLRMHQQSIWQDQVTEMQQSGRASMRILTEHIRMAGFNLPGPLEAIGAFDENPDSIVVTHTHPSTCQSALSEGMDDVYDDLICDTWDLSCFEEGMWIYIYDALADSGEFAKITDVLDSPARMSTEYNLGRAYPMGSLISRIERFTFFLDKTDSLHPKLMMRNHGDDAEVYAEDIEDLQFDYVLTSGDTVEVPSDPTKIRNVIVGLTARTPRIDDETADGDYRRRQMSFTVNVRNLEYARQ